MSGTYLLSNPISDNLSQLFMLHTRNPKMARVYKYLGKLFDSNVPVLFAGEAGTGKEVLARLIHANGRQRSGRFIIFDCAAGSISELDGKLAQVEEIITNGTTELRPVHRDSSSNVTIFLRRVENLSPEMQHHILGMLQNKARNVCSLSGEGAARCRVLASTAVDLGTYTDQRKFRKDLYYRLSTYTIAVPSLRERREDIRSFAHHFCLRHTVDSKGNFVRLSEPVLQELHMHSWPGNVRELRHVVLHAIRGCNTDEREITHLGWLRQNGEKHATNGSHVAALNSTTTTAPIRNLNIQAS